MSVKAPVQQTKTQSACECGTTCASTPVTFEHPSAAGLTNDDQRFRIANMDCASEESEIRQALVAIQGIRSLRFDLTARELTIAADPQVVAESIDAIRRVGFKPEPLIDERDKANAKGVASHRFWDSWGKLICALILSLAAEGLAFALQRDPRGWPLTLSIGGRVDRVGGEV